MIEKHIKIDKIEIVGDYRHIQTRLKVDLVEDGVVIGRLPYVRLSVKAPDEDVADHPDITIGKTKIALPQAIKDEMLLIAGQVWTKQIKDSFTAEKAKKGKNE